MPFQDGLDEENKINSFRLFIDENTISTFFRRPDFSPDGSLLMLPTSQYQKTRESPIEPCILVFRRGDFSTPCCLFYTGNKPVIAIKFNKNLYKSTLTENKIFDLNYKMIFAAGTLDSIFVFSTESPRPIIAIGNIHYSPITDLSWKLDASILGVSSSDGYCSFVKFEKDDFGEIVREEDIEDEKLKGLIFRKPNEDQSKSKEVHKSPLRNSEIKPVQSLDINRIEIEEVTETKIEDGKKKIVPTIVKSFN